VWRLLRIALPAQGSSQAAGDHVVLPSYVCLLAANDALHAADVIFERPHGQEAALGDDQFPLVAMILHVLMNMQFYPSADGCLPAAICSKIVIPPILVTLCIQAPHSAPCQISTTPCPGLADAGSLTGRAEACVQGKGYRR
jgi:hypothetical protein